MGWVRVSGWRRSLPLRLFCCCAREGFRCCAMLTGRSVGILLSDILSFTFRSIASRSMEGCCPFCLDPGIIHRRCSLKLHLFFVVYLRSSCLWKVPRRASSTIRLSFSDNQDTLSQCTFLLPSRNALKTLGIKFSCTTLVALLQDLFIP
jgi:hypothetical protein